MRHLFFLLLLTLLAMSPAALGQSGVVPAPSPVATPTTNGERQTPLSAPAAAGAPRAVPRRHIELPPEKASPVRVPRLDAKPVIDGRLDEPVWSQAAVLKDFYQTEPGDNITPSQPTEVLLGYDSQYLYVAFRVFDDPSRVRATVPKRDDIWADDNVGILLDTFDDQRSAYVLYFSPFGVQADGTFIEGRGEDYSVDLVMESKGALNEKGYVVEVALPFKSLRYKSGNEQKWRVHFFRRIRGNNNELNSWMPISRDVSGTLSQAGHITGFEGISTQRTLELIPSLTLSETGRRTRSLSRPFVQANPSVVDPGRFVNAPIGFDPGLTARLGLTPTTTLDLTFNPDFAQVEADETVVTANQRFPIFFEEKRPFFLEGIEIFKTPLTAVHTRAIVDPDVAVKLTGRRGRDSFGLILASDNAPGNFSEDERSDPQVLPFIERFLDKNAYIGVLRLKRDVGKESNVGLVATTYNFIERHNHVGGFDGRFRLSDQAVFVFQALGTTSRRFFYDPVADRDVYRTGNGFGYSWDFTNNGRHIGYFFRGEGRTRDYSADVGFTPRRNTNLNRGFITYKSEPNGKAKLVAWRVNNLTELRYDWQGRSQYASNNTEVRFTLQRQTFFGLGYVRGYERLFEEEFGPVRTPTRPGTFIGPDSERSASYQEFYAHGETIPNKTFSFSAFVSYLPGAFDFDFGGGPRFPRVSPGALLNPSAPLDPGPGDEFKFDATLAFQPTQAWRSELRYVKDRLTRHDTGLTAFDVNIYALRSTYQFTRFTFFRARLDYETQSANLRGQFLVGWTPNPGTSFYAGYNNDLNYNGFSPFDGRQEPGFRTNGQTFFIKMSYLFRRSW